MSTPSLPIWIIILDVIGTLLIAAGIFFLVSDGDVLGMPAADLRGPAIGMLVVGGMLTVPLVVTVVRRAAERSRAPRN